MTKEIGAHQHAEPVKLFFPRGINVFRIIFHLFIISIFALGVPLMTSVQDPQQADLPFPKPVFHENEIMMYWTILSLTIIPFYFINAYVLISRYLVARKYIVYGAFLLVLFTFFVTISKYLENILIEKHFIVSKLPMPAMILPTILLLALGTSFEMVLNWEFQKRNQESIEKEKIAAERSFLKSQINPHFLFNTLNNIYSLAERNSEKTGQSILLLSNLIRYILYDTTDGKILLANEITHIDEYIALQRMRIVERNNVAITFDNKVKDHNIMIEPLLFIPFIENAFKHGISYASKSYIKMDLAVEGRFLKFRISNSKRHLNGMKVTSLNGHGVGIVNTRRRLDLLYPERHQLRILDEHDSYAVELVLHFEHQDFV